MLNLFTSAPDVVAYPENDQDVALVLDWASGVGAALIPFGGGSSVCGGVTPPADGPPVVTLNLSKLDKVLEIDHASRAARIQAGVFGPALEDQLRPHKLTLRHFPAKLSNTRRSAGGSRRGRADTSLRLYTHIDDFVESLRVVTPAGTLESRRLPGSGAGPSPDRMFIGSEGILGVITEAWMRLQNRPIFRGGGAIHFKDFFSAARALRVLSQTGLYPSNCRILDPDEAHNTGAADGSVALMVLAFESADHPRGCLDEPRIGGLPRPWRHPETGGGGNAHLEGAAGQWRNAFIRMPYARELLTPRAIINDTFETAITWDRFEAFHDSVKAATEKAIRDVTGKSGQVTCRFTHVYPGRSRTVFQLPCAWAARRAAGAVAGDQERSLRRAHRGRRHDHAPSRGWARAPALVRSAASGPVRGGAEGGEKNSRSTRDHEPRGADRSVVGGS